MKFTFDVLCLFNFCFFTALVGIVLANPSLELMGIRWSKLITIFIVVIQTAILMMYFFNIGNLNEIATVKKFNVIGFNLSTCVIGTITGFFAIPFFQPRGANK